MYDEIIQDFFSFSILLMSSHTSDHPQKDFSQIWLYMLERKVQQFKESCYILTTCWNLLFKYENFRNSFLKIWQLFGAFFSQKS
jgi:hypothetical protein